MFGFWWGFAGMLWGIGWATCVFGCWWLARNSGHSTGYAVFWGIAASIIALPFYMIFYYRDRDTVPNTQKIPLGFTGGSYGRRERACLDCGRVMPDGTKYCSGCGREMRSGPA